MMFFVSDRRTPTSADAHKHRKDVERQLAQRKPISSATGAGAVLALEYLQQNDIPYILVWDGRGYVVNRTD